LEEDHDWRNVHLGDAKELRGRFWLGRILINADRAGANIEAASLANIGVGRIVGNRDDRARFGHWSARQWGETDSAAAQWANAMPIFLLQIVTVTITLFALNSRMSKPHPVERNVVVQVTVSRDGELETFDTLSGNIKVDGQTFKVWRNTLILCGRAKKCHMVE
jgi:hypothetical protein